MRKNGMKVWGLIVVLMVISSVFTVADSADSSTITKTATIYDSYSSHNEGYSKTAFGGNNVDFRLIEQEEFKTKNDTITSGNHTMQYWGVLRLENRDDDTNSVLSNISYMLEAQKITSVSDEQYAQWNDSFARWDYPGDFVIREGEGYNADWHTNINYPGYVPVSMTSVMIF